MLSSGRRLSCRERRELVVLSIPLSSGNTLPKVKSPEFLRSGNTLGDDGNRLADMGKKNLNAVLAENLRALMAATPALGSSPKLAKKSGAAARTINNAENSRHDAKLSTVEAIARAFGLEGYQLLVPGAEDFASFVQILKAWQQADELEREILAGAADAVLRRKRAAAANNNNGEAV
jgi:transcriptional regulator with XRE-family HTH domain